MGVPKVVNVNADCVDGTVVLHNFGKALQRHRHVSWTELHAEQRELLLIIQANSIH